MPTKKILVTGATGLIGRRLVARLVQAGARVRVFVRTPAAVASDGVETFTGVIEDRVAVERAVEGCQAVVHLANATGVTDEDRALAVNVGGTENLLSAARAAGVERFVFTSTISAMRERLGPYGRSKRLAEERVRESGVPYVILRPSLVYGGDGPGLVASLARYLRTLPVVPVIGNGKIELDPVHLDDLCTVIEACLERDDVLGKTYDVLGPDRVTLDDFLHRLGSVLGVHRPLLHLPATPSLLLARLLSRVMAHPPITVDNVLGLTSPARVDRETTQRAFPISWTPLDAGLQALKLQQA